MKILLLLLHRLLVTPVQAVKLEQIGLGGAGVADMWMRIMSTLPFSGVGASAPAFILFKVMMFIMSIVTASGILVVIYGGIMMITKSEEGYEEGKKIIRWAVIGIALTMVATTFITFVSSIVINDLFNSA